MSCRESSWHRACGLPLSLAALLLVSRPAAGLADSNYELLVKDRIAAENVLADVLTEITDPQTGRASEPLLKASLERLDQLANRMKAMPKPGKDEDDRLKGLHDAQAKEAHHRVEQELIRVKAIADLPASLRELVLQVSKPAGSQAPISRPAMPRLQPPRPQPPGPRLGIARGPLRRPLAGIVRQPAERFAPDRIVRLNLKNAGDLEVVKAVYERLQQVVKNHSPSGHSFSGRTTNSEGEVTLAPVDMPLDQFAKEIDFGKVTRVNQEERVIDVTITWTRDTMPSAASGAADEPKASRRPGP